MGYVDLDRPAWVLVLSGISGIAGDAGERGGKDCGSKISTTSSGTEAKNKGADNVLERSISVAQSDATAPVFCSGEPCPPNSIRPLPTYTRQDLVYGEVENQMQKAEAGKAKLITQRESLITQRESLITQQLQLERQKGQLLEQGLGANATQIQGIQSQVKALDGKISKLTGQVESTTKQVNELNPRVNDLTLKMKEQDQYIQDAAQYLKEQAKDALSNPEQFIRDFYKARTEMYPKESKRYQLEMESLLQQYRKEKKQQGGK